MSLKKLSNGDILNLRLYYLIGVPYETPADVEAIVDMAKEMRSIVLPYAKKSGRMAKIGFHYFSDGSQTPYPLPVGCDGGSQDHLSQTQLSKKRVRTYRWNEILLSECPARLSRSSICQRRSTNEWGYLRPC